MENKNLNSQLFLCATPIGNLEDMTFRAVRILKEVDFIAAEDTRHTRKLLSHFDIHTPLIRYDENNKNLIGEKIIQRIVAGESCACVSDAGVPAISDPGADLVKLAIAAGVKVSPIPGANAAISALICSGLDTSKFTFVGFLPKTSSRQRKVLADLKSLKNTLIFYESPHRLKATLQELMDSLGDRQAALARELTKVYEEIQRGKLSELLAGIDQPRGEFVIIVEGASDEFCPETENLNLTEIFNNFINEGLDEKAAMRETAKKLNLSRRDVYKQLKIID